MGLWNNTDRVETLQHSSPFTVFDATTLSDGNASTPVALPYNSRGHNIMFEILFGSAPTTVDYRLQVAMDNVLVSFHDTGPAMIATAGGAVTVANVVANFVRIIATDSDTQTVTGRIFIA